MNVSVANCCWTDMFKFEKRISREFKLAFVSACVIGLITHLYVFSNLLLGNDATNNTFSSNAHLPSGRWALEFFSSISSIYQMPVVIGLISVVMLALTAGLTVRILDLTHPAGIVLTSALLVTFPPVASTFAYMFTADAYFIALFMNAAAAYLAKKHRFGWIAAIALVATACGIYQAYICYAAGLLLFDCIVALLTREKIKTVLVCGGKYILALVMGLLVYYVIEMLLLNTHDVVLTTYQGMDTIGQLSVSSRLAAIPSAYKVFGFYFVKWPYISSVLRLFQWASLSILGFSLLYLMIARKLWREPMRLLLIAAGCLLIPLTLDLIAVLAYTANIHRLMIYAFVLLLIFPIKCAELAAQQLIHGHNRYWQVPLWAVIICCMAAVWNNFCITNIQYHSLELCYENSFALANRIVVQVEMLDDYSAGDPVAIIGYPSSDSYGNMDKYQEYSHVVGNFNLLPYKAFFQHYIGLHISSLSGEQLAELKASEVVAAMPVYPARGSIAMVNGIAVVKLGEGESIQ